MTATTDRPLDTGRDDTAAARSGVPGVERNTGLLIVRVVIGAIFVAHGAQKLFGAFGGQGIDGTAKFFAASGYSPGTPFAVLAGLAEFGGGIALILGLGASLGGAAIVAAMAGATAVKIDGANGSFFAMNGGYEYELVLTLVVLGLTLVGAGRFALDHGRPWDRRIVRIALAAAGVLGGVVAVVIR